MLTLISMMFACSGETPPPPKPEPAPMPEPPPPEPPKVEAMTVDALAGAFDANVGKEVVVKGFYSNLTKQEAPAQLNIPVYVDAEMKGAQLLCISMDMAQEAMFAGMTPGSEVMVKGTVSKEKFFDNVKLENCGMAPDMEGKAGKMKAKADGEGKAGKGDEGDAGKAGKGKKGG
jgi:hypothetical protein